MYVYNYRGQLRSLNVPTSTKVVFPFKCCTIISQKDRRTSFWVITLPTHFGTYEDEEIIIFKTHHDLLVVNLAFKFCSIWSRRSEQFDGTTSLDPQVVKI